MKPHVMFDGAAALSQVFQSIGCGTYSVEVLSVVTGVVESTVGLDDDPHAAMRSEPPMTIKQRVRSFDQRCD